MAQPRLKMDQGEPESGYGMSFGGGNIRVWFWWYLGAITSKLPHLSQAGFSWAKGKNCKHHAISNYGLIPLSILLR